MELDRWPASYANVGCGVSSRSAAGRLPGLKVLKEKTVPSVGWAAFCHSLVPLVVLVVFAG